MKGISIFYFVFPVVAFLILSSCFQKKSASFTDDRQDLPDSGRNENDAAQGYYQDMNDRDRDVGIDEGQHIDVQEEITPVESYIDYSNSTHERLTDQYLPLDILQDVGWRESKEPFCGDHGRNISSGDGGIILFGGVTPDGQTGRSLFFNDGTGWSLLCESVPIVVDIVLDVGPDPREANISRLSDTKYLMWNEGIPDGILSLTTGSSSCKFDLEYATESYIKDLFVVNDKLAYAVLEYGIVQYDGSGWTPLRGTESEDAFWSEQSVWADEETLAYLNGNQIYLYDKEAQRAERIEGLPPGSYTTIWGFSRNDIWAGNQGNQLVHYDGTGWEIVWTGNFPTGGNGVKMMWGAEQKLFFAGDRYFAVYDGQQVVQIANWTRSQDSMYIDDVWGNSSTEVFLTYEGGFETCSEGVFWYDGKDFRRI